MGLNESIRDHALNFVDSAFLAFLIMIILAVGQVIYALATFQGSHLFDHNYLIAQGTLAGGIIYLAIRTYKTVEKKKIK